MSEPLPRIDTPDISPGTSEPEPSTAPSARILSMKAPADREEAPATLDERLDEVIHEVQNGPTGWGRFEKEISETLRSVSGTAKVLFSDVAEGTRRVARERPVRVIAAVALASFCLGAVLRMTRSRYE